MPDEDCARCRTLLVVIALVTSLIVAVVGGLLAHAQGFGVPASIGAGGGAYAIALGVILGVFSALRWL